MGGAGSIIAEHFTVAGYVVSNRAVEMVLRRPTAEVAEKIGRTHSAVSQKRASSSTLARNGRERTVSAEFHSGPTLDNGLQLGSRSVGDFAGEVVALDS